MKIKEELKIAPNLRTSVFSVFGGQFTVVGSGPEPRDLYTEHGPRKQQQLLKRVGRPADVARSKSEKKTGFGLGQLPFQIISGNC